MEFKKGTVTLNISDKSERNMAIYLSFHPEGKESKEYIQAEKAMPKIKGLKRMTNRAEFVFDFIQNLHNQKNKIV